MAYTTIQDGHVFSSGRLGSISSEKIAILNVMPLSEYNKLENESVHLAENEVLLFTYRGEINQNTIDISGNSFKVKDRLDHLTIDGLASALLANTYCIVVPDLKTIEKINSTINENPNRMVDLSYNYAFDAEGKAEDEISLTNVIQSELKELSIDGMVEGSEKSKESFYSLYGGLFFLGIFLGALFIMATVLIIYYKQISEGFDDKHRFEIMQKVGLSKAEVKKAIHSQVLIVFFLPLVTAVIHIAFAFTVISKLLALLNLTNVTLFALTTGGTILVFAIFYAIVYSLTAREYYKIVS
jgi:putative ABC transport system permease protein